LEFTQNNFFSGTINHLKCYREKLINLFWVFFKELCAIRNLSWQIGRILDFCRSLINLNLVFCFLKTMTNPLLIKTNWKLFHWTDRLNPSKPWSNKWWLKVPPQENLWSITERKVKKSGNIISQELSFFFIFLKIWKLTFF
jgi:hypothetical protein